MVYAAIITLKSADKKLDYHYEKLGFKYNYEISEKFSEIISQKQRDIMYLNKRIVTSQKKMN